MNDMKVSIKNEVPFERVNEGYNNMPSVEKIFESNGKILKEVQLKTQKFLQNGVYTLQIDIPVDGYVKQHCHQYAHTSILAKGKVTLIADGVSTEHVAPTVLSLKEGVNHEIFAKEDSVWFCIHQTNETDINKVEDSLTLPQTLEPVQSVKKAVQEL